MSSLPGPTHLEIRVDEWQVAQEKANAVEVEIRWRGVREDSALAELLAALPPRAGLVPISLVDGRTELAPKEWKGIRFGGGPPIFESARHHYDAWAGGPQDHLATTRKGLTDMIQRYIPNFDSYTDKEQVGFIIRTQEKINAIHDGVEALIAHLEYGAPDKRKPFPPLKNPRLNVRAAVFCDVLGSSKTAGELLGIPLPTTDQYRNENQTVRKMAVPGRELLHSYFGEAEWAAKVRRMREYHQWWQQFKSLDDSKEQIYFLLAKARGTSPDQERLSAKTDGFDRKLDEWVAVVESRFELEETLDQWEAQSTGNAEWTNTEMERRSIQDEQFRIQATDDRFDMALSMFDSLPQG